MEKEAASRADSLIGKTYDAYQKNQSNVGGQSPSQKIETVHYTILNDADETVRFKLQPSGKSYSLSPGRLGSYSSKEINGKPPTILVLNSGKTYELRPGDHKFFWFSREDRIGFDLNYKT
jgi:hypothetical protein